MTSWLQVKPSHFITQSPDRLPKACWLQVTGRLLTSDDQLAATVTRPWLLPYRSPLNQRIRQAPLLWRKASDTAMN